MTELGKFGIALASNELTLTAPVTAMHRTLLASYRMNAHRGADSPRNLIIRDLRSFLDLGAFERATDLLIVLALLTKDAARCERRPTTAPRRHREAVGLRQWRGGLLSNGEPIAENAACSRAVGANFRLVPAGGVVEVEEAD
jgi:hypothetical protein